MKGFLFAWLKSLLIVIALSLILTRYISIPLNILVPTVLFASICTSFLLMGDGLDATYHAYDRK